MKHQYFADAPDFAKYALLETLMGGQEDAHLALGWMLTEPEDETHGHREPRHTDGEWRALREFLIAQGWSSAGGRLEKNPSTRVGLIKRRWESHPWVVDAVDDPFTDLTRHEYFQQVAKMGSTADVLFLDPDVGIEPRSGAKRDARHKYVRASEIHHLRKAMRSESVLVTFQWIHAANPDRAERRLEDLRGTGCTGDSVLGVLAEQVLFVLQGQASVVDRHRQSLRTRFQAPFKATFLQLTSTRGA